MSASRLPTAKAACQDTTTLRTLTSQAKIMFLEALVYSYICIPQATFALIRGSQQRAMCNGVSQQRKQFSFQLRNGCTFYESSSASQEMGFL
jgi:hypothetical protein